jgi:hypothetical protein
MTDLAVTLSEAGGAAAPPAATAHLRERTLAALADGRVELGKARAGYDQPVTVAFAAGEGRVLAATPADARLSVDPNADTDRAWLVVAATVAVLVELAEAPYPRQIDDLQLQAGAADGRFLALGLQAPDVDWQTVEAFASELFAERAGAIPRLRARALTVPPAVLADVEATLRDPIGEGHPLRVAEAVARLGGDPTAAPDEAMEEAVLALGGPTANALARPHEDPDPARRAARRILQRLDGMGKWGGYHTDFAHLARGFAGNERRLAQAVGEALVAAGLLESKPSVGQRHVYLNPRRAADIRRLIETGELPRGLKLP